MIARARLRRENTASAKGAARMLAHAVSTARAAGVSSRALARADSAYYGWAFVGTAREARGLVLGDGSDDQDRGPGDRRHR